MEPAHTEHKAPTPAPTASRPAPAAAPAPAVSPKLGTPESHQEILRTAAAAGKKELPKLGITGFQLVMWLATAFVAGYAFHWWQVRQQEKQQQAQSIIEQLRETLRNATNQIQAARGQQSSTPTRPATPQSAAPETPPAPANIIGRVQDTNGVEISTAIVRAQGREVAVAALGYFSIPVTGTNAVTVEVTAPDYHTWRTNVVGGPPMTVVLRK